MKIIYKLLAELAVKFYGVKTVGRCGLDVTKYNSYVDGKEFTPTRYKKHFPILYFLEKKLQV